MILLVWFGLAMRASVSSNRACSCCAKPTGVAHKGTLIRMFKSSTVCFKLNKV